MRFKYAYILPIVYILFLLTETFLSEISSYPFHESNTLLDLSLSIIAYISVIIDLPSNLIFDLTLGKMPFNALLTIGVSLTIYFLIGISLDLYRNLPKKQNAVDQH